MINKKINKNFLTYILAAFFVSIFLASSGLTLTVEEQYHKTLSAYKRFLENPEKIKHRDKWLFYLQKFQAIHKQNPSGHPAALYITGEIYQRLYKLSLKSSDKKEAIAVFERIIKHFPRSEYRRKAEESLKTLSVGESRISSEKGKIPEKQKGRKKTAEESAKPVLAGKGKVAVNGLRIWSNPSYTRIVIDADNETSYRHKLIGDESAGDKPLQLCIDFDNSRLGDNLNKGIIPINDDLLTDAKPSQLTPDSVRVVIDIKSFKTYKIFSLKNPFKTIIDVWGKEAKTVTSSEPSKEPEPASEPPSLPAKKGSMVHDLAKQLALGVRRIVIDAGHGGKDVGAVGYYGSVYEKHVTLDVAKKLAQKIRQRLGCEVFLTRTTDRSLSLEERTAIANTKNADLFISIHTNASNSRDAHGIETYFLNLATDDNAILVAARENATSRKNISDLQTILHDLMKNSKINESSKLAAYVQNAMYRNLRVRYSFIKSKGVKQAPFYVLMGAQMPSILIETSFISNKRECERLNNPSYQDALCESIISGISKYIKETHPTAFMKEESTADNAG
jgi:N-acetylmuramoyl-L-alanine amidase